MSGVNLEVVIQWQPLDHLHHSNQRRTWVLTFGSTGLWDFLKWNKSLLLRCWMLIQVFHDWLESNLNTRLLVMMDEGIIYICTCFQCVVVVTYFKMIVPIFLFEITACISKCYLKSFLITRLSTIYN